MFAGAAFTDQSDIAVDSDVVDTMVALGVIEGYTDGSFRPDDTVTRAEMAKMIYVVRTGRSDASAYNDDATSFTDIGDHWARGYIKYCNSLGIIAGHSATRFAPDDTVTTQEAAKMLLVTLGYNAETAGLVGAGWGTKTIALADENGLLNDVNCGTTQGMPRQYAAQLIYNTIFAPTVAYRDGEYTNLNALGNGKNDTVGEKYMDLLSYETTLVRYTDGKAVFADTPSGVRFNDYTADHSDLVGREVRVLYKAAANVNGKATIYGLFEVGDNTYIDTIVGDVTDYSASKKEIDVNGTTYDVADDADSSVTGWSNYDSAQPATVTLNDKNEVYKIEKDGDFKVAKVTFVGTKTITAEGSYDVEDVEAYDGIAKDDWIVVSKNDYTNNWVFTKADVITGEVEVENGDDFTIDGVTYTKADDAKSISDLALGNTVEVVVVDGYIYNCEKVSGIASLDEIVYINGAKVENDYGDKTVVARAVFSDGTSEEIQVVKIGSTEEAALITALEANGADLKQYNGMYVFDQDDDEYTLRAITSGPADSDDFEANTTNTTVGDDRIGGFRVNDEAVVFVVDKDGDVSVKTGAEVAGWTEVTVKSVAAYANKSSGVNYVDLAAVVMNANQDIPGSSSDAVYGYVTKTLGQTKEDNTTYNSYELWTADGTQTIKVKNSNDYGAKKLDFVKFENDKLTKAVVTEAALTGLAGDSLYFDGGNDEYVITDDTQVIYINVADESGVEGGDLQVATDVNGDDTDDKNVAYEAEATKNSDGAYELKVVFVDVNNDIKNVLDN